MATFMATVPVSSSFLRQTSVFFNFKKFSKNNVSYFLSMYLSRDSMYNFPKTSVEYRGGANVPLCPALSHFVPLQKMSRSEKQVRNGTKVGQSGTKRDKVGHFTF